MSSQVVSNITLLVQEKTIMGVNSHQSLSAAAKDIIKVVKESNQYFFRLLQLMVIWSARESKTSISVVTNRWHQFYTIDLKTW